MTEREETDRARKVVIRGCTALAILWVIGMAVFIQDIRPRNHGWAVHVPGGIEIYP